jgi:parallel beta helix pectate lyase-like protein
MNRRRTATLLGLFVFSASSAFSAANKVFVSAQKGDDANACTLAAPCRQFTKAISVVNSGGDVIVLDSGAFQPFTITLGVSIIADGVVAEIAASTDGIVITTSDDVTLRGLTITGMAPASGTAGIKMYTFGVLHVENCVVRGAFGYGIYTATGKLFVQDTIVKNGVHYGMLIYGSETSATVTRSSFLDIDQYAVYVQGLSKVTIRDSVASGNGIGFHADGGELNIESSVASKNVDGGVESANGGVVRVSSSTITDNGQGLSQMGASTLYSRGNNTVEGNTQDTVGTITPYSAK